MKIERLILLLVMLSLGGCIRQKIEITLRPDGSGDMIIEKVLGDMEGAMMSVAEMSSGGNVNTGQIPEEEKKGPLITTARTIMATEDASETRIRSEYHFADLGQAIPVLSQEIILCPRFTYRDDRFMVFIDREKQEFDGQKTEDEEAKKMFYHLSVTFPVTPHSPKGKIEGHRVSWQFSGEDLQKMLKLEVGTRILEAWVPAKSFQTKITPTVMTKKEHFKKGKKKDPVLQEFSTDIKIWEAEKNQVDFNTQLSLLFPVKDLKIPFPYTQLKVEELILDGKSIKGVELVGESSGVFSGKDRWGRASNGFPMDFRFNQFDPWVKKLDRIDVSMETTTALSQKVLELKVTEKKFPIWLRNDEQCRVALQNIQMGSSRAMWPEPSIEILTTLIPEKIIDIQLDTDFGIRYEAEGKEWEDLEPDSPAIEKLGLAKFKEEGFKKLTLSYPNIPSGPFHLRFLISEGEGSKTIHLTLEDLDVSL